MYLIGGEVELQLPVVRAAQIGDADERARGRFRVPPDEPRMQVVIN